MFNSQPDILSRITHSCIIITINHTIILSSSSVILLLVVV